MFTLLSRNWRHYDEVQIVKSDVGTDCWEIHARGKAVATGTEDECKSFFFVFKKHWNISFAERVMHHRNYRRAYQLLNKPMVGHSLVGGASQGVSVGSVLEFA
jgi:hypothetical protein